MKEISGDLPTEKAHIKKEILIKSDIANVWKVFCELEKWPLWGGYIIKSEWISGKGWAKNSRFSQTVKGFWLISKFKSEPRILEVVPFKRVKWAGTRKLIKGTHTFLFKKIGRNTKVSNLENFSGILAPFVLPVMRGNFESYFEQFLEGLKRESER